MNFPTCFLSYGLEYPFGTIQDTEVIDHLIQFLDVPTYNKANAQLGGRGGGETSPALS